MKKQLTVVLLVLVLVLTVVVGIACEPQTEPTKYTVTYAAGDGSGTAPAAESYEQGASVTLKAASTFTAPEGKEFDGWLVDGEKKAAGATITMPAKDLTITAQWKDKSQPQPEEKWTVTFKCEGQEDVVVKVVKGQKLTAEQIPAAPSVAEGKEFKGWFNGETQITVDTVISGNITATAKIENKPVEKVTVIFKIGDNTVGTKQVVKGGKLTQDQFPDYTPDEGKVLVGWFDSEDNKIDENTVINSDLTVTAKIENAQPALTPEAFIGIFDLLDENEVDWLLTITAKADAAEGEVPLSVTVDEDDATDIELTVVGGKQQLSFSVTMGLGSATVYTMTLESDGSFTLVDNDDMAYTVTKRGDDPNPSRPSIDDYQGVWIGNISFKGNDYDQFRIVGNKINLRDEYYGQYYDNDDISLTVDSNQGNLVASFSGSGYSATLTFSSATNCNLSVTTTGTLGTTVNADFVKAVYVTVSFNMGEGYQGTPETIADKQVVAQLTTSAPAVPSWEAHRFLGWFAPEATQAFDFANTPITENITLTAHWEEITEVTVTYVIPSGVTGITAPEAQTVAYNDVVTEPNADSFARKGYRFDGWYNGNSKFDFANPVKDNVTLTAKWVEQVTVTYVYPEIVGLDAPQSSQVDKNKTIQLPACPKEIDGYDFVGWAYAFEGKSYAGATKIANSNLGISGNVTLTAVYGVTYTVAGDSEVPSILLRSDGWLSYGGGYAKQHAQFVEYKFSDAVKIVVFNDYMMYRLDSGTNKGAACTDSLFLFSFTANDGTTALKFDGAGNLLLGELAGTYTWNDDYSAIKIIIAGQQATLNLAVKDNAYVIDGYFEITVNETKYQFGEEPVEYTVNFELGGGTGTAPAAIKVMSNVGEITLPGIGDATNGEQVFKGWAVKDLADSEVYPAGTKIEVSASATLVAVWGEKGGDEPTPSLGKLMDFATLSSDTERIEYGFTSAGENSENSFELKNASSSLPVYKLDIRYMTGNPGFTIYFTRSDGKTFNVSHITYNAIDGSKITDQHYTSTTVYLKMTGSATIWITVSFSKDSDGKKTVTLTNGESQQSVTWTEIGAEPVTPPTEPVSLVPYNGEYSGSGISMYGGYSITYITINGDQSIAFKDDEGDGLEATIKEIKKVDSNVVVTFEYGDAKTVGTITFTGESTFTVSAEGHTCDFSK